MKTLIATTAVALATLTGAAMANPQLEASAQQKLNRYDVAVDASTLTDAQLTEIQFIDVDTMQAAASVRSQLIAATR